jgi:hypothetical protein
MRRSGPKKPMREPAAKHNTIARATEYVAISGPTKNPKRAHRMREIISAVI